MRNTHRRISARILAFESILMALLLLFSLAVHAAAEEGFAEYGPEPGGSGTSTVLTDEIHVPVEAEQTPSGSQEGSGVKATPKPTWRVTFYDVYGYECGWANVPDGDYLIEPEITMPEGYRLLYWYDEADEEPEAYEFGTAIHRNINLWPHLVDINLNLSLWPSQTLPGIVEMAPEALLESLQASLQEEPSQIPSLGGEEITPSVPHVPPVRDSVLSDEVANAVIDSILQEGKAAQEPIDPVENAAGIIAMVGGPSVVGTAEPGRPFDEHVIVEDIVTVITREVGDAQTADSAAQQDMLSSILEMVVQQDEAAEPSGDIVETLQQPPDEAAETDAQPEAPGGVEVPGQDAALSDILGGMEFAEPADPLEETTDEASMADRLESLLNPTEKAEEGDSPTSVMAPDEVDALIADLLEVAPQETEDMPLDTGDEMEVSDDAERVDEGDALEAPLDETEEDTLETAPSEDEILTENEDVVENTEAPGIKETQDVLEETQDIVDESEAGQADDLQEEPEDVEEAIDGQDEAQYTDDAAHIGEAQDGDGVQYAADEEPVEYADTAEDAPEQTKTDETQSASEAQQPAIPLDAEVTIRCITDGGEVGPGSFITLVAELEELPAYARVTYQWQNDYSGTFEDVPGATSSSYSYIVEEEHPHSNWRVIVHVVTD